ncbi:MAG TPA: hypothetical protein VHX38_00655 [Pseudonocardiaceae bacterium]|jgi:hypothetical protein|nr:hypothetical protein [Pseudonocardiaceae bacterium]
MTAIEVLDTYGAARLARFVGSLALLLVLHLLRKPLQVAVRVLEVAMRRADAYITRQASPLIVVPRKETGHHAYAT